MNRMEYKTILKKNLPYLIFIALALLTLYIGLQTYNLHFFEFDPYMYLTNAKVILANGFIMQHPNLAYTGIYQSLSNNRFEPLIPYLMVGIFSVTKSTTLEQVANIEPPIFFILMASFVFILFEEAYKEKLGKLSRWLGLYVGSILLFIPVLMQQFVGGMFQEEAFGFFSVIALITLFYLANKTNKLNYTLLAGIMYIAVLLGSKYFTLISIIIPFFIIAEVSILYFKRINMLNFIKTNLVIGVFALFGNIFLIIYDGGFGLSGFFMHNLFIPINLALLAVSLLFAIVLYIINYLAINNKLKKIRISTDKMKGITLAYLFSILMLIIISIPILPKILKYIGYLTGFSFYRNLPLFKTVAEFSSTPIFHLSTQLGLLGNIYIFGGIISLFTIIVAYKLYKKENNLLLILLIPTTYPLIYTGMHLSKYIPDLGIAIVLMTGVIIAEIFYYIFKKSE